MKSRIFFILVLMLPPFILNACLKFITRNVPEDEYRTKVENIETMDEKNEGFDLQGWTYGKIESPELNIVHRYYHFSSTTENAPVIVFLHGLNIDGRVFIHLKELASDYELIAYDFPHTSEIYSGNMDDYVILLNDFFKEMQIDSAVLGGVSFGGIAAIHYYAADRNITINKMILMATLPGGTTEKNRKQISITARWIKDLPDYKLYFILEKLIERDDVVLESAAYPKMDTFVKVKNIDWYRQVVNSLNGYNASGDASKIDCPVLAIHGEDDETVNAEVSKAIIEQYIPQSSFVIIPEANHGIVYEKGEEVTGLIFNFLKQ
jgi:pimeloyl-ACP methyl ester carboxylesterase